MRVQAFEFMDLHQTPRFLRDSVVESLGNALRWSGVYKSAAPAFREFCKDLESEKLLDLCSGSGEPAAILLDALKNKQDQLPYFLISDLFPVAHEMDKVVAKYPNHIEAIYSPLDASDVPQDYSHSARMVVSAFHHFSPELATSILKDSAENGKPIFILEPMTRNPLSAVKIGFFFFLANLMNPLMSEQDRFLKAVFTYLIPVIPLMASWDGLISILRMYTEDELKALTSTIDADYHWEFQQISARWGDTISVFTGKPN